MNGKNNEFRICTRVSRQPTTTRAAHSHLKVHSPGHDQRRHQQVGHSQADHQVVGGGLQGALPQNGQAHQHIAKDNGQDEERVEHGVVVPRIPLGRQRTLVALAPSNAVRVVPELLCTAKHRHGGVPVAWERRCLADLENGSRAYVVGVETAQLQHVVEQLKCHWKKKKKWYRDAK